MKNLFYLKPGKGGVAEMLAIALPMIVSTACDGVMTFTDRLFLSRLGSEQMNAAMGGGVAMQMMMFFFIGLTGYTTALVAQYYGSGQKKMSGVAAFQAILIALVAYPVILLCRPLSLHFFNFMHVPEAQLPYQISYFNIVIYGVLFSILRNCLSCYFSGLGRTKVVMMAALVSVVVNVVLDYILIFGKLGFPAMGIRGAAIATVVGSFTGLCVLIIVYLGRFNRENFAIMNSFKFNWAVMRKLLYFGYPAGLELFLNFLGFTVIIFMFHSRGDEVATATTIMFSWDLATFIPLLGIEIAVTSLVGRYMGAGDPETAHKAAMSGIKTGIFYSAVVLVLFVSIPETLARVFRPRYAQPGFRPGIAHRYLHDPHCVLVCPGGGHDGGPRGCTSRGRGYALDHDCFRYLSLDFHSLALGDVSRAECFRCHGLACPGHSLPCILLCLVSEIQKRKMEKDAGD